MCKLWGFFGGVKYLGFFGDLKYLGFFGGVKYGIFLEVWSMEVLLGDRVGGDGEGIGGGRGLG